MLGQFLEFSFAARPLAGAYEFYRSLGFASIAVGDLLRDPYVALFDGDVAIGLHERDLPGPVLTFVRPQLRDYVRALRRAGIAIEQAHLADDEFNHVALADPNGQAIELLEARTFAPGEWNSQNVSACGRFLEYSVATHSIAESREFWEPLGFALLDEGQSPHAWVRLKGRGLVIGLHQARFQPGLCFRSAQLEARLEYLRAKGHTVRPGGPHSERIREAAMLSAPDGGAIYLVESADSAH
jgi:catechol 2,3-dioxygenase-like lactoylglutathione lyase family enzyme